MCVTRNNSYHKEAPGRTTAVWETAGTQRKGAHDEFLAWKEMSVAEAVVTSKTRRWKALNAWLRGLDKPDGNMVTTLFRIFPILQKTRATRTKA